MLQQFQEESQLIPIISSKVLSKIRSGNYSKFQTTTELDCGYGIADVVFYALDPSITQKRLKKPLYTKKSFIQTLIFISQNESVSITYLSDKLSFSKDYIKYNILKYLINDGFVRQKGEKYSMAFDYEIGLEESIAIEAKLADWKRGLYQAYRYKWFAEESYLAIDEKHLQRPLDKLGTFKKLNVGLISINSNGKVNTLFKPTPEFPYSIELKAMSYEEILRKIKDLSSPTL